MVGQAGTGARQLSSDSSSSQNAGACAYIRSQCAASSDGMRHGRAAACRESSVRSTTLRASVGRRRGERDGHVARVPASTARP